MESRPIIIIRRDSNESADLFFHHQTFLGQIDLKSCEEWESRQGPVEHLVVAVILKLRHDRCQSFEGRSDAFLESRFGVLDQFGNLGKMDELQMQRYNEWLFHTFRDSARLVNLLHQRGHFAVEQIKIALFLSDDLKRNMSFSSPLQWMFKGDEVLISVTSLTSCSSWRCWT